MLCVFNHNGKNEWNNDQCYNVDKHWKHPKWKKPYRKTTQSMLILYTLNPTRFLKWGKAPVMVPRKEIRMEKYVSTKLGQLVKVEAGLGIGL